MEKLTAEITNQADFEGAVGLENIDTDLFAGEAETLVDYLDDGTINSFWGVATPPQCIESGSKINFKSTALTGAWIYMSSGIHLPLIYKLKYDFDVISCAAFTEAHMGIGWDYAAGGADNPIFNTFFDNALDFYIYYVGAGATRYYWTGAAWSAVKTKVLTLTAATKYTANFTRSATHYSCVILSGVTSLASCTIAITSIDTAIRLNENSDRFFFGRINADYEFNIYYLRGFYMDRFAALPAKTIHILDMGQTPPLAGEYRQEVDTDNLSDQVVSPGGYTDFNYLKQTAASQKISQPFKVPETGIIEEIKIAMQKVGAIIAGNTMSLEIYTDSSGLPGTLISAYPAASLSVDTIPNFNVYLFYINYASFIFQRGIVLDKGTTYHFVLSGTFGIDVAKYIRIPNGDDQANKICVYDGATWSVYQDGMARKFTVSYKIRIKGNTKYKTQIASTDTPDYDALTSKADFESHNAVQIQVDTATTPGKVLVAAGKKTGRQQNDLDIGRTPTNQVTLNINIFKPQSTAIKWRGYGSNDGAIFYGVDGLKLPTFWSKMESLEEVKVPELGPAPTITGTPTYAACRFNSGTFFPAGAHMTLPRAGVWAATADGPGSFDCWITITSLPAATTFTIIDSRSAGTLNGIRAYIQTLGMLAFLRVEVWNGGAVISYADCPAIPGGTFHLGAFWEAGIGVMMLIDNVPQMPGGNYTPGQPAMNSNIYIGADTGGATNFINGIDNLKFRDVIKATYADKDTEDTPGNVLSPIHSSGAMPGLYRYYRLLARMEGISTTTRPEISAFAADAFPALTELNTRKKVPASRYHKIVCDYGSDAATESAIVSSFLLSFRIAYELFIKRVKYKISNAGISADLELSSE